MGFNPVLGFLSVSTEGHAVEFHRVGEFQSRAGFSECLDLDIVASEVGEARFQSRAGFSECLDALRADGMVSSKALFQSRAGFSECLDLF